VKFRKYRKIDISYYNIKKLRQHFAETAAVLCGNCGTASRRDAFFLMNLLRAREESMFPALQRLNACHVNRTVMEVLPLFVIKKGSSSDGHKLLRCFTTKSLLNCAKIRSGTSFSEAQSSVFPLDAP